MSEFEVTYPASIGGKFSTWVSSQESAQHIIDDACANAIWLERDRIIEMLRREEDIENSRFPNYGYGWENRDIFEDIIATTGLEGEQA